MDTGAGIALISLAVLVFWFVGFLKNLTNRNWNGAITQVIAFLGALGAVALYAHTRWAEGIHIDSTSTLAGLSWAEQCLVALSLAAGGGTLADGLRTFNRSDGKVQPTLIPSSGEPADSNSIQM